MLFQIGIEAMPDITRMEKDNYAYLMDIFGLPRQKTKDLIRTEVSVSGIEVGINFLITLNQNKELRKSSEMTIAKFDL